MTVRHARAALKQRPCPKVKAVIFDAFGTVLKIHSGCHPYRQILKHGRAQGRPAHADDAKLIMTNPLSLQDAADHFGITVPSQKLRRIQAELDDELRAIEPYEDALTAIQTLKSAGIKVAICSNLAQPYSAAIERLFRNLDAYGYSFAVGVLKPDPRIYQNVLDQLGVAPGEARMIGDSKRCDRDGPTAFGIKGHYLARSGQAGDGDFAELKGFAAALLDG